MHEESRMNRKQSKCKICEHLQLMFVKDLKITRPFTEIRIGS